MTRQAAATAGCPEHSGLDARLRSMDARLERIEQKLDSIALDKLPALSGELAGLRVRAGLLGGLAGTLGAVLAQLGIGHWGKP